MIPGRTWKCDCGGPRETDLGRADRRDPPRLAMICLNCGARTEMVVFEERAIEEAQ